MRHGSLFSGIGGFDLASDWMGWENIFHCENNGFCQNILKQHWPNSVLHEDITTTDFRIYRGGVDILTGGEPCQPHSLAGKREGKEDKRYLWPQYKRAVIEIQPKWAVNENVPGSISNGILDEKISDLEAIGYAWWPPIIIPACAVGSVHLRERVWLVAYSSGQRISIDKTENISNINRNDTVNRKNREQQSWVGADRKNGLAANANEPGLSQRIQSGFRSNVGQAKTFTRRKPSRTFAEDYWKEFPSQSPVCGRDDGISNRVDRIKSLGNAIVPQIAYELFKAIEATQIEMSKVL